MSRRTLLPFLLFALPALADNPETLAERSQTRARGVLDAAVVAIGGADSLQAIERVKLKLVGKTWPRLQMTTAQAPFEPGTFEECFRTPTLPAASAGAANRNTCQKGKFQGMTASTGPRGS